MDALNAGLLQGQGKTIPFQIVPEEEIVTSRRGNTAAVPVGLSECHVGKLAGMVGNLRMGRDTGTVHFRSVSDRVIRFPALSVMGKEAGLAVQ